MYPTGKFKAPKTHMSSDIAWLIDENFPEEKALENA